MRPKVSDTEAAAPCRTRLAKRIFRDVDSLAAARSEVKVWCQRTRDLEKDLRQAEWDTKDSSQLTSQRSLVAQRMLENQVGVLQERLADAERTARWRDNQRKSSENKASEAMGLKREAEEEALRNKRKAEDHGTKVTAAERAAHTAKNKYTHLKEDLRTGALERSSLSEQIKQQRCQIRGEQRSPVCDCTRMTCAALSAQSLRSPTLSWRSSSATRARA